jgi:hypothetical protein
MRSQQIVAYAAEPSEVRSVLRREIEKAVEAQRPVSFFAVAPLHHAHERHLCTVIKRLLAQTNTRHGADWIVSERQQYRYFVALGADLDYTCGLTGLLQQECDSIGLMIAGSIIDLPKAATVEEQARQVYEWLSEGVEDHRRKLPTIYPSEITLIPGSSPRSP